MGDVRARESALEVLGSYHPFWLRLGLEAVVGRALPVTSAGPRFAR